MFKWIVRAFTNWLIQTIVISVTFELVSAFLRGREQQAQEQDQAAKQDREQAQETV
jgi:hypothetical protein